MIQLPAFEEDKPSIREWYVFSGMLVWTGINTDIWSQNARMDR